MATFLCVLFVHFNIILYRLKFDYGTDGMPSNSCEFSEPSSSEGFCYIHISSRRCRFYIISISKNLLFHLF